ncbi:MAG: ACP S-malonyltransferase [Planctomycetaceae bacterium]
MTRAALFLPGRGSYTRRALRSLPGAHPFLDAAEGLRREYGLPSLAELDRATSFHPPTHLLPSNAAPLIYLVSWIDFDAEIARGRYELVALGGNSMGWYTALAAAGALGFEDGFRLVQEMALLQQEHPDGGQLLYPLIDDQWRRDPKLVEAVGRALAACPGEAFPSIDLGGYVVLAGTEQGVKRLVAALPPVEMGANAYPMRLAQHGPYHTPLLDAVAQKAAARLAGLGWRAPRVTLVDGRGRRHTPWSTDVEKLRDYTLGEQVTTPYDVALGFRVLLREYAPDRIVLPGPGNTMGSIAAQALIAEGWRGIRSRADFERVQAGPDPAVVSMRRE